MRGACVFGLKRGTVNARGLCTRTVYVGQITRGACVLRLYTWDS